MDEVLVLDIFQQAMLHVIMLSAPMLLIGLLVGLAVSIFQATTQIQEATLAFVPKILAVFISIIIFSPWLLKKATEFTIFIFGNINNFIK